MAFFEYQAEDESGKVVSGRLQAASSAEASKQLELYRLRIKSIREANSGSPAKLIQPPVPVRTPRPTPAVRAPIINAPTVAKPPEPILTKRGSDKDRFFLFSQLAAAMRSGINPAQAFADVSRRAKPHFSESLEYVSSRTVEGGSIADSLARYPDLYPHDVVGVIRAGETAGFLPEALEEVSEHAKKAHSFRRWHFWVSFLVANSLLVIPLVWISCRSMIAMWDAFDSSGGTNADGKTMGMSDALPVVMRSLWQTFRWPWGPITIAIWLAIYGVWRWYCSRGATALRHRVALQAPVYGKRARHESLARFSWTMSRVAKAGVTPARAWQLATDSVPNLIMRDQIAGVGGRLNGQEKMSDLVFQSRLFPDEYAPVVATAEYTGDLPGAMDQLAQMSAVEFQTAENYAKVRGTGWGCLVAGMTAALCMGLVWQMWYHELPEKILKGFE